MDDAGGANVSCIEVDETASIVVVSEVTSAGEVETTEIGIGQCNNESPGEGETEDLLS